MATNALKRDKTGAGASVPASRKLQDHCRTATRNGSQTPSAAGQWKRHPQSTGGSTTGHVLVADPRRTCLIRRGGQVPFTTPPIPATALVVALERAPRRDTTCIRGCPLRSHEDRQERARTDRHQTGLPMPPSAREPVRAQSERFNAVGATVIRHSTYPPGRSPAPLLPCPAQKRDTAQTHRWHTAHTMSLGPAPP